MIIDTECRPIPPSDIEKRVKQVHPSLGMWWHQTQAGGSWCFTEKWGENDPRREDIKKGKLSADRDFDIMGFAPPQMSQDDAFGFLLQSLRNRPSTKDDYNEMLNRVTNYNAGQQKENMKDVTDLAEELIETNAGTLHRDIGKTTGKVFMNGKTRTRSRAK